MPREYLSVLLAAVICVLMSTKASGQPTIDDDGTCDSGLATSEQLANLIRKVEQVLASNQQQSARRPTSIDASKYVLVSALKCEYRSHSCDYSRLYLQLADFVSFCFHYTALCIGLMNSCKPVYTLKPHSVEANGKPYLKRSV